MTSDGGFSGNTRYLILPATLVLVLAGTGVGWALRAVAPRAAVGAAAVALAVLAAGLFALPSRARLAPTLHGVAYQARLTDELGPASGRAGGKDRLLACGSALHRALPGALGGVAARPAHARTSSSARSPPPSSCAPAPPRARPPAPSLRGLGGEDGVRTLAATPRWRIVGTLRASTTRPPA